MDEITVPIYLITGFLESGKTFSWEFYPPAGLLPYRGKDTSHSLRRGRGRVR